MSWRTVVISTRSKLDLKLGYLVIRSDEVKRIFLDEIAVLIIENPAVSLTGCLIEALTEKKIKVIFCDSKRSPAAELLPYYGSHDSSKKIRIQTGWTEEVKGAVWTEIVSDKIKKQAYVLNECNCFDGAKLLQSYLNEMEYCDASNREGHAAKVYFNALFGKKFARDNNDPVNAALNYGYSILLAAFNREVTACGYITQIGLHHSNVFNEFNLSSDLMEPYRPLVDRAVKSMMPEIFGKEERYQLVDILNKNVNIGGKSNTVLNSISIYVRSIFKVLETGALGKILFYEL